MSSQPSASADREGDKLIAQDGKKPFGPIANTKAKRVWKVGECVADSENECTDWRGKPFSVRKRGHTRDRLLKRCASPPSEGHEIRPYKVTSKGKIRSKKDKRKMSAEPVDKWDRKRAHRQGIKTRTDNLPGLSMSFEKLNLDGVPQQGRSASQLDNQERQIQSERDGEMEL